MTTSTLPSVMKAWQYSSTKGGLEKNLKLNSVAFPTPKPNQHVVQVIATALNPIDYKPAEIPFMHRVAYPKPATPGIDFAGRIVVPSQKSSLQQGQLVFGIVGTSPFGAGGMAEYAICPETQCLALPEGLEPLEGATIGVAGLSALQSIRPHVKKGDSIFINGGSGGTGVFGIQIAKALGCYVATSCSTPNVELCKSLGADLVVDYKTDNVVEALIKSGCKFDHVVDNVGADDDLYWRCHEYTKPDAKYVSVAGSPALSSMARSFKRKHLPAFLGGGRRKAMGFWPHPDLEDIRQIAGWMTEGKVKAVVDEKFPFEKGPDAIRKLKTGRAKGKIVVDIALGTSGVWKDE